MHKKDGKLFAEVLRASYHCNYTDMKNEKWNYKTQYHPENKVKEKIKKKWRKCKRKKSVARQKRGSRKSSDFVELGLQRSKLNSLTDNRKQRK